MATLEPREQRGIIIAAVCRITWDGEKWLVPSQSEPERKYRVRVGEQESCTCPDHAESGFCCKHIRAVRIVAKREMGKDGTVTETKEITFAEQKVYRQRWSAYNESQRVEKRRFQVLLHDLCSTLAEPERAPSKKGRKPHLVRDSVFAMVFKVYCLFSSRRFSSDLEEAHQRGYTVNLVPGMKTNQFFENPAFTPILRELVAFSALPLRSVETKFAIDSTGFSVNKFERWYDIKYGVERKKSVWVKAHAAVGVRTNVITAVRILEKDSGDSPQLKPLVVETAQGFNVEEVSGDKAYTSIDNFETVAAAGGTGFFKFKVNATGGSGGLFQKMFHWFQFNQDDYLKRYHQRSNVESTFSAVKRKFGDSVRCKSDTGMKNEVLCKFIAHNLCVLIQEQHELGIDPVFWKDEPRELPLAEPAILQMPSCP